MEQAKKTEAVKANKGFMKWIIGAILLVVLAFFGFTAEVREGEYAVITRFGAVRAEVTEAGLYAKLPWPFENVNKYDVRNQYTESEMLETLTKEKRNVILQSFAVWHVNEPLKYHNSVGDNVTAENFLNSLILNASNSVLGKYEYANVVSSDPEKLKLSEIEEAIHEQVKEHALRDYGIEVSELRIMKLSLPQENLASAFNQMSTERQRYIDEISAKGQRDASAIIYEADIKASETEAEGVVEAAAIDKETERLVAEIYANAQAANKELYTFLLELETVKNSVDENDTLIIKKGEFLEGLFSEELIQKVKDAQAANNELENTP